MTDPTLPPGGWGAIGAAVTAAVGGVFWWLARGRVDVTAAGMLQASMERMEAEINELRQKQAASERRERKMLAYIGELRGLLIQHGIATPPPLDIE